MRLSRLIRTIQLALKSLMLHKLRSGLTMLGIVFGVFSVIAMLAIGEGASQQAQDQVLELGALNIIIRSVKPPEDSGESGGGNRSREPPTSPIWPTAARTSTGKRARHGSTTATESTRRWRATPRTRTG